VDVKLPQLIDYQQAVYGGTFADPALRNGRPRLNPQRQPSVASGGFALTFEVTAGGRRFAVRCFHKQSQRLRERYTAVADFVGQHRNHLDFLTEVAYVPDGIRVNGNVFPIVRMPWVDGQRLDSWVENHLHEPHRLDRVRNQIMPMATRLRAAGAAHGDLQHGNIMVDNADRLRLIDYDGMFLPALAGFGAAEQGLRNYQHPDRGDSYDSMLDVFAAFVIDLSLDALKHDPSLWREFNTGENLILEAGDFAAPAESEVFDRLVRITPLADRTRRLMAACEANFPAVPAILAGERTSAQSVRSPDPSRVPTGPRALDANDRAALITRVGDHVTIVGRVTGTRVHVGDITTTTFINFGDYRNADFTIVAFGKVSRELEAVFGKEAAALRGSWVTLSGMVTQFQTRWCDQPTPQIELERVQTLRELNESDARDQLAPPRQAPPPRPEPEPGQQSGTPVSGQYRWKAPPKSRPNPKVDDLDRRLSQRYSSRSSAQPTAPPPPRAPQPYRSAMPRPAPPPVVPTRTGWWQRLRNWWRQ
jgi:hypothetical protein